MKILTAIILATLAFSAAAETHLDVKTTVQKEETFLNDAGEQETRLVTADVVVPGEKVFYTISFRNNSEEPADNVVITNPIAADLLYVDGSGFGPGTTVQFSVDGGKTFAKAEDLVVIEDGVERTAEERDFTHIRWVMKNDLEAGAQGTARFAAILK